MLRDGASYYKRFCVGEISLEGLDLVPAPHKARVKAAVRSENQRNVLSKGEHDLHSFMSVVRSVYLLPLLHE